MDRYKYEYDAALLSVRAQPDVKEAVLKLLRAGYELAKEQIVDHPEGAGAAVGLRTVINDLCRPDFKKPERADG